MHSTVTLLLALRLSAALAGPTDDPRIELIEPQLSGNVRGALARAEELVHGDPRTAAELWVGYLKADLLERLGRIRSANSAYAALLSADSEVADFARLGMARTQAALGHPEVAAGVLANLLGQNAPPELVEEAVDLLVGTLTEGADCRLLGRARSWVVPAAQRRKLDLASAECGIATGAIDGVADRLLDLLRSETDDLVARDAADLLVGLAPEETRNARAQLLLGRALHHNREFERSVPLLETGLSLLDPERLTIPPEELAAYRYETARGYFWLRRYDEAAALFGELAEVAEDPEIAASSHYQKARCYELSGDWPSASQEYRAAFAVEPTGDWSGAALFSALRIHWRMGKEALALELFGTLGSRAAWRPEASRAALFLASSDLVRGRTDRAGIWLQRGSGEEAAAEFLYWRGRLAEAQGQVRKAVTIYAALIAGEPYHPLSTSARARLQREGLLPAIAPVAQQFASTGQPTDLHASWLLLGDDSPSGQAVRQRLETGVASDRRSRKFVSLDIVPAQGWPLWSEQLSRTRERFLALGVWRLGEPAMKKHFPYSEPSLAYTSSVLLGDSGMTTRSLYVAEVLSRAIPAWVPPAMLPSSFRRLLYPYAYRPLIEEQARLRGVDPTLLASLIREESRFNPQAVSAAAARGLTQFTFPTALEVAPAAGIRIDDPGQLHDPAVAIALGAAYLQRLHNTFGGRVEAAITAYNAGEDQTRLWESYCFSRDPAEYFSKVGFVQTRHYLRKVLTSRAQYQELYSSS